MAALFPFSQKDGTWSQNCGNVFFLKKDIKPNLYVVSENNSWQFCLLLFKKNSEKTIWPEANEVQAAQYLNPIAKHFFLLEMFVFNHIYKANIFGTKEINSTLIEMPFFKCCF